MSRLLFLLASVSLLQFGGNQRAGKIGYLDIALRGPARATVVGEKTGGGGHVVMGFPLLPAGFQMLLPVGRSFDPRTSKGWEAEGITPDLEVNPEQALQAAIGHLRGWRRAL